MDRALGRFWPRARSKLYEEPKKLVALGLAKASAETVGKRPRTVYSITPKGRRALAAWVPTPGDGPALEFDLLVRVFFAEHGTKSDLLATLDRVRAWTEEQARTSVGINERYLEGEGQFPERLPWLILVGRFLDEFADTVDRWRRWAADVVAQWPDDITKATPDVDMLAEMAKRNTARLAR
jgi:DNA-binding PadR family transcriptional regulator